MEIRMRETGEVLTDVEFMERNSAVSFPPVLAPDVLAEFGADAVLTSPMPVVSLFEDVERDGVEQDALGNWVQAWKVTPWTDERIIAYARQLTSTNT